MKLFFVVALTWLTTASADSRDLTINDQQQAAVSVICEKAARSPALSIDDIASISQFCLMWRSLVQSNAIEPKPEAPTKKVGPEPGQ